MKTLEPPDTFYYCSAVGWMELGNKAEAEDELSKISPQFQEHPDVLELKWTMASNERDWERCADIASEIVQIAPEREFGWIHYSFSLHQQGRTEDAWEALVPAADQFPDEFLIPYNLACYSSRLGKLDEARFWIVKAIRLGGLERVKKMAEVDSDLVALWAEIQKL